MSGTQRWQNFSGGGLPSIDEMNKRFSSEEMEERPCAIRFSIGAILFERMLWENMNYFTVSRRGTQMGRDEVAICEFCSTRSMPIMVSENVLVGHLSFGKQNQEMEIYFKEHPDLF